MTSSGKELRSIESHNSNMVREERWESYLPNLGASEIATPSGVRCELATHFRDEKITDADAMGEDSSSKTGLNSKLKSLLSGFVAAALPSCVWSDG